MNSPRKVAFHTLGCKLNYSETSAISRLFEKKGYDQVEFDQPSDVYVINTCSVTANADKECKSIVRNALNVSPDAFVVIIGCYAQLKPHEIARIDGVDLVLGASEKFKLLNYLDDIAKRAQAEVFNCEIADANVFVDAYSLGGNRTRAFLKVQDGCDYTCSFCTIPLARGSSRSDSIENSVKNAAQIAFEGVKEIVLTGVNLGDFGKGLTGGKKKETGFIDLISELDQVEGIDRFRISSIEPNLLSNEVIEFVSRSKRFVPHFHIPLQSGSDKILRMMRRRYLTGLYSERIQTIRTLLPQACIGVDVIVGFPGETDGDFLETYNYLNQLDISYLHVFTYSERENTDAVLLKDSVPPATRKKRNKMLRILSAKKLRSFYEKYLGTEHTVLFEQEGPEGTMHGFTENYIKVKTTYNALLYNTVAKVTLSSMAEDGCVLINGEAEPAETLKTTTKNAVSA